VALSYVRIEQETVVIRRWPGKERRVPRAEVDRSDVLMSKGERGSNDVKRGMLAPHTYLALVLKDGTAVPVPYNQDPAILVARLNNELAN
jgi:hypothetical protein